MNQGTDARDRLLRACYSFLVPIARFLLRSGITFTEFAEISRAAFVRVAATDYGIRGRETNTSRIAAMTGMSRREVTRIRAVTSSYEGDLRVTLSPKGDVLHRWHTDPEYLDSTGQPAALPMTGSERSFAKLVASVSTDIPPGAMRIELIRDGAIAEVDGLSLPRKRHIVPDSVDDRLLTSLTFNLRGLTTNIAHNSDPNRREAGWIERFAHSGPLNVRLVEAARDRYRTRIQSFSEEIDDSFAELERKDPGRSPSDRARRIGIGVFYVEDDSF